MGGYVTQTRNLEFPQNSASWYLGDGVSHSGPCTPYQPQQTTYSWRTKRGQDQIDLELPDDQPLTEKGVFHFLQEDNKRRDISASRPYDTGHEFSTQVSRIDFIETADVYGRDQNGLTTHFKGPLVPGPLLNTPPGLFPIVSSASGLSTKLGNIAIKNVAPTHPASSFGQGFGELAADGFSAIPGSDLKDRVHFFRSLGSEYLNVEFGWLPFIADLRSSARAIINRHALLRQYQRDSGRPVRRAFHFEPVVTYSVSTPEQGKPISPISGLWEGFSAHPWSIVSCDNLSQVQYQLAAKTTLKAYFKGSFLYYLPDSSDTINRMERAVAQAKYLLGVSLDPELLWQLTPWTWLIDWFTHIGRMFSSWSRFSEDGLVLQYGYLMASTETQWTQTLSNVRTANPSQVPVIRGPLRNFAVSSTTIRKERFRSTPYGFGIDTSHLTDFQWSILAALGLAKAPKVLH